MTRLPIIDSHERPDICGPCGGKCCKHYPGIPHPDDFGAPDPSALRAAIKAALDTGRWVIAHDKEDRIFGGNPECWYPRPALKGAEGRRINDTHFEGPGECAFLADGRCEIYETRPRGCRELVPVPASTPGDGCRSETSKIAQVDAWAPYESILLEEGWG